MEMIIQTLAEHAFFKEFQPADLEFIQGCATLTHFEPGEFILREGEAVSSFYLICQGRVSLGIVEPESGFRTLQTLGEGEVMGLSWLIPPFRWHFSALVVTPAAVIELDAQRLREKCERDHDFGYEFLKRLSLIIGQRLKATRMRLSPQYNPLFSSQ